MELRPHHPRRPRPLPLLIVITLISDARDVINHWNRRVATARAEFTILDRVKKTLNFQKKRNLSLSLSCEKIASRRIFRKLGNYSKTGRRRTEQTEIPYRSWCIALVSKSIEFLEHTFLFCLFRRRGGFPLHFRQGKYSRNRYLFIFMIAR